jgi:hypothetical protein
MILIKEKDSGIFNNEQILMEIKIMQKDILTPLIGKKVKLSFGKNNSALWGTIDTVSDDFLVFTTQQKTSVIALSEIKEIVPV